MAKIKFESSILEKAIRGDKNAISTMFQSFIGNDEQILDARYFGCHGILFSKTRSFVCLTDKRLSRIEYGPMRKILRVITVLRI